MISNNFYKIHSFLVVIIFFAVVTISKAQVIIKGTIRDADGPLIGAAVVVKGTSQFAIVDTSNFFALEVKKLPVVLVSSFVGYQNNEIILNAIPTVPFEIFLVSDN